MDNKLLARDIVDYILIACHIDGDIPEETKVELTDEVVLIMETN